MSESEKWLNAPSPAVEELRAIQIFSDLSEENLEWLASRMRVRDFAKGEVSIQAGDPADYLIVILKGEVQASFPDGRTYFGREGQVTGMLPFSRLTTYKVNVRASAPTRSVALSKEHFPEMLQHIPVLQGRLVNVLSDRIRESTAIDQQREKMMALGRLSAGLAHELNNPAAAAQRASANLRDSWQAGRMARLELDRSDLPAESRVYLAQLELDWIQASNPPSTLDTLERSEREDEIGTSLDRRGVAESWRLASSLVDLGCTIDVVTDIAAHVPPAFLAHALTKLTASFSISRLSHEIENSTARISELVQAIKEYSYMDRMPEQEIDIHAGLETTLIMLRHRFKEGVELVREYDRTIPKVMARGSELNQIWTNLIVNALDAMQGKGKLIVRTSRDHDFVCVEIIDNGPGIPDDVQVHIFEPFFTTKPVGQGTGLGLDTSYRIASNHGGSLTFESRPGETRFSTSIALGRDGARPA